ncbi:MAG: hypothetical protein KI786_00925, partial [Mameliella sp.]|nr:hypothetical protein [Phaeodactylibacter sp.]
LFWGTISKNEDGWTLTVDKLLTEKALNINELITFDQGAGKMAFNGQSIRYKTSRNDSGRMVYQTRMAIDKPGKITLTRKP